jgi:Arc/MetJ-type ribon-helix-helix transcriptional regulator
MAIERTTIQISENLRKRIKLFASMRDIPYEDLLSDLLDIFESSIPFKSKEDFARFFEKNIDKFGFKRIVERRYTSSPDYKVEDFDGEEKEVELELFAKDFERHKRRSAKVDCIVSLFSTVDNINGIPVISVLKSDSIKNIIERFGNTRHTTISIPLSLHKRIRELIKNTGFNSVSEYVIFVLREIVAKKEEEKVHEPFTEEDVEYIKQKLKALGYL